MIAGCEAASGTEGLFAGASQIATIQLEVEIKIW